MTLLLLFLASVAFNVHLSLKQKKQKNKPDYDATQLLHDLTGGDALVKVTRISPENVLLRSPRDL